MIVLRSLAFAVWAYGITAIMALCGIPLRWMGWRSAVRFARVWVRLVLGGVTRLCGITWEVSGLEHLPEGAALIASMHQSAFDTVIWTQLAPWFAYVMKRELTRVPLAGMILLRSGMIPVDRQGGTAALRSLLRGADRAVAQGRQIVIFPEGTRVAPGRTVPLQPGVAALAARTGLPVIPVVTDSGLCWGRRSFLKRPGVIHIRILPPLPAGLPRDVLMERLRDTFASGWNALAPPVDNSVHER